ncbi:hypothetical protein JY651_42385 [Pyxidicoccus parkwayensis]|uniref:Uncharacterized protein n=1 Tax=Pyxidicoccus parkwayensis TaxID=2813578 RepID=A0ABX7NWH8_9BACT|nr:hypothetical protein [Pyxidicoccus parkwaysis]QSQ21736.1 hypothetical protein JY651_42385 [Pyxidicoccus parkwaysis]
MEQSHGDCQLPLGYDGVVRIRAVPHLVLRPEPQSQPTLLNPDIWQVLVGGSSENVAGNVPCRLEWIVTSDCFAEKRVPHRRETCLTPNGKGFMVREKDGEGMKPLVVSVYELGLIGTGRLGFRLEPLLFGNQPVEVKPGDAAAIPFDLGARIDFGLAPTELKSDWLPDFLERHVRGVQVGSLLQLKPDITNLFNGHLATLDLYPTPVEGVAPDEAATLHVEWEVGHPDAAKVLLWRVGFLAVRGGEKEVLNNRLAAIGGMESSSTLGFQYRLGITKKPKDAPPAPEKKKGDKKPPPPPPPMEGVFAEPRLALEVPRPRLKSFGVRLDGGRLGIRGSFENFNDSVELDLTVKTYVRVPYGEGWRVEELDDFFRNVLESTRLETSLPIQHTEKQYAAVTLCLPDDVSTLLAEIQTVTVTTRENTFEREVLNLKQLPRHYVEVLKKVPGLQVFAAIQPTSLANTREAPFWAVADYEASEPGKEHGFAPFEGGAFVSRVFANGVCTGNTVDLSGEAERLSSPIPIVPPELQEEFSLFVGTVCGEAIGQSEAAWKGVAHTIMNRVARRQEWVAHLTPTDVITKTGFDGRKHKNCEAARAYLKSPASSALEFREKLERLITAVTPIYMRMAGDGGDPVYFYSPAAQKALHAEKPTEYPSEKPGFVDQGGDKALVDISAEVLGGTKDDFRFYAFRYPEKNARMTRQEIAVARAQPPVAKGK